MADNWEGWSPKAGATSQSTVIRLISSAGAGVTGKLATNLTASYLRQGGTRTAISLSDLAAVNSAYSSGGVKEIDATNFAGLYRLDLPDAALATGAEWAVLGVVCSGSIDYMEKMILKSTLVLDVYNSAATLLARLTQAILFDAAGNVKADLRAILGTVLTETAGGWLAAAFKKLFDVAAPVLTATSVNQTGDNYARIGANGAGLTALGDARLANLDATVGSRLASGSYTAPDNTTIGAISTALTAFANKFTGITLVANWLRLLGRKDAADATAKTEFNSGGGAYNETTDSQEAIRDRGDVAWATGTVGDVTLAASQPNYAPATVQQAQDIQDAVDLLIPGAPIEQTIEIGQTNVSVG